MTIVRLPDPVSPDYSYILKEYLEQEGIESKISEKDRIVPLTISTIEMDRDGEIVLPKAFEMDIDVYKKNPVVLLFHGHKTMPVGKCVDIEIRRDKVIGKIYLANTPLGNEVLTLIREGCLNGVSAGFVPIEYEENPPIHKIPPEAMKTSNGRRCKKMYSRVELVEISLLPIPSNRSSLIEIAEKGNSVAGLILKSFDVSKYEDLEIVIKEWMEVNKPAFTLKSLLAFDESEHPRDNSGRFTESSHVRNVLDPIRESNYYPNMDSTPVSTNRAAQETSAKMSEANARLGDISHKQDKIKDELRGIRHQGDWGTWFKKWGIVIASVIGGYLLLRHRGVVKGVNTEEDIVKNLLDIIKQFIDKGKELGLEDSNEYRRTLNFYQNALKRMPSTKGLSCLLVTKEMTAEEFKEEEHPRHADGKFRKKSEGSGPTKAKAQELHHEVEDHTPEVKKPHEDSVETPAEKRNFLKGWARMHKGKLLAATGVTVAVAFIPTYTATKIGARFMKYIYSPETRKLVNFTDLTRQERRAFLKQAQPGDIFLQSSKTYTGLKNYGKDVKRVLGGEDLKEAKWTIQDPIGRAMEDIEYPHSALVVGHYDKKFHDEMMEIFPFGSAKEKLKLTPEQRSKARMFTGLVAGSVGANPYSVKDVQRVAKQYLETQEGRDELWKLLNGRVLLVLGSTNPEHNGTLRMVAQGVPFGGGIGAFLRTKVPLEQRQEMAEKIKEAYFARAHTNPKIQFAVDEKRLPTSKENIDIMARNTFYPFFEPLKGKFSQKVLWKDDAMVCHGAVAALYEQFGGIKLGKEFRYMTARDLVGDKKFADIILEAKKKRIYEREDWVPAEDFIKRNRIITPKRTIASAAGVASGAGIFEHERREHKGLSGLLIVTKEMTKEEFIESEHPRGSDGRFVDKNEMASPSPEKGSWGGYRSGAGRMPKDPVQAQQKLIEKFKTNNPNKTNPKVVNYLFPDFSHIQLPLYYLTNEQVKGKGIDIELTIKEMTKEEFKEEEHPRTKDGRFKENQISKVRFNYEDETGFHNWLVSDLHKAPTIPGGYLDPNKMSIRENLDPERVESADLTYPVLISKDRRFIVDGQHRIAKARKYNIKKIPYRFIDLSKVKEVPFSKGLSQFSVIAKEMTKEEFIESEHPRGSDGRFVDKNEMGATPAPKTSWGGTRPGAGRLAKDPVEASQKLTERIKSHNPNVTDEEIRQQLIQHAVSNKKTDMYQYLTDPVAYQQQREKDLMTAAAMKRGSASVNGKKVTINGSEDIDEVAKDIKASVSNWNKEVAQAKTLDEAIRTYKNKDADAAEVRKARVIMAAAIITTGLLATSLIMAKPKSSLIHNPLLDKTGGMRTILAGGVHANPLEESRATYLGWAKGVHTAGGEAKLAQDLDAEFNIDFAKIGAFQRLIGNAAQRLGLKSKDMYPVLGKKILGRNAERYRLGEYYRFKTDPNTILLTMDADAVTGLRLVDQHGTINPINLALSTKKIPFPTVDTVEFPPGLLKVQAQDGTFRWKPDPEFGMFRFVKWLKDEGVIDNVNIAKYEQEIQKLSVEAGEDLTKELGKLDVKERLTPEAWEQLVKAGKRLPGNNERFEFTVDPAHLPKSIARRWKKEAKKAHVDAAEKAQSTAVWIGENAIPFVSRKVLAGLVPFVGLAAPAAYYYQRDFDTFSKAVDVFSSNQDQAAQQALMAQATTAYNKKEDKELDRQLRLTKARTKESEKKLILENYRNNVIDRLINILHARKDQEGFVTLNSLSPAVIQKRFIEAQSAFNYGTSEKEITRLNQDLADPEKALQILAWINNKENVDLQKKVATEAKQKENEQKLAAIRAYRESLESKDKQQSFEFGKGLDTEIIIKGMLANIEDIENNDHEDNLMSLDEMTTLAALEVLQIFTSISESCRAMIENGVPDHSSYEDMCNILTDLYVYMKEQASKLEATSKKIEEKSFDKTDAKDSESIVKPEEKSQVCAVCKKAITEENVMNCKKNDCPNSFLDQIKEKD